MHRVFLKLNQAMQSNLRYFFIVLLVLPSLFWILLDKSVWPWDQSWYGQVSTDIYYSFSNSTYDGFLSMLHAFAIKAPAIAWIGQFAVLIGAIFNQIDKFLLFFIVFTQFINLILMYLIIKKLFPTKKLLAYLACIVMASAPLFVGMSHQYFVEPLQMFVIIWFIYIMVFSHEWNRYTILLNLISALSFGMLVKVSSPLYIVFPALYSSVFIFIPRKHISILNFLKSYRNILHIFVSVLLLTSAILWYRHNWKQITDFVLLASSGSAAELYGTKDIFLNKFIFWLNQFQKSFFLPYVFYFTGIILILGIIKKIVTNKYFLSFPKLLHFNKINAITLVSALSVIVVIITFCLQINQETRYLMPILPYVIIVICWIIYQLNYKYLGYTVLIIFLIQFLIVQLFSLGIVNFNLGTTTWLSSYNNNVEQRNNINEIINRTCTTHSSNKLNAVGIEYPYFNANSLSYYASKYRLITGLNCSYTSLGYVEDNVEDAWNRIVNEYEIGYFITLKEDFYPKSVDPFNMVSLQILEKIKSSNLFELEKDIPSHNILIFRNISVIPTN